MLPVALTPAPLDAAHGLLVVGAQGISRAHRRAYCCASCGVSAWGKLGMHLVCGDCRRGMPDVATQGGEPG